MSNDAEGSSPSPLSSAEYRKRLLRKLDCLIAVLKVATKKVERSLDMDDCDEDRLLRIRTNLHDTMEICQRARQALEDRTELPPELRERLARVVNEPELENLPIRVTPGHDPLGVPPGVRIEVDSEEELHRLSSLGRIEQEMIDACDLDDLARRLID